MGAIENLLARVERLKRSEEKRTRVIRFLRQEIFSSQEILGLVMGVESRTAAHRNLVRFESEELLRRHTIVGIGGGSLTLWGITSHGQAMAFIPGAEDPVSSYFEPGKIAELTIRHSLDLQRLRVIAERGGWSNWINGDRLETLLKGGKRPDAIAYSHFGFKTAIEVERTIKTTKRYEQILANYLMALKATQIQQVIWLSPTPDMTARLRAIVLGIPSVTIEKQRFNIDPTRHHANLFFDCYGQWPNSGRGA